MSRHQLTSVDAVAGAVLGRESAPPLRRAPLTRRDFVMVAATLGAASWLLNACKWGADPMATAVPRTGRIAGEIVDLLGAPQPLLGRIFLMYESGLQTGQSVSVDGDGRFAFADIPEGEWQLRFHAPGVAYVPEQLPHPVRVTIMANETTTVRIAIERGWEDGVPMVEIYIGDYFFQEQPFGSANGETVVTLGTPVCWYNVGLTRHTATGGFWDSGALDRTASYIWVADRVGTFPYTCKFHGTQMIATLRVHS